MTHEDEPYKIKQETITKLRLHAEGSWSFIVVRRQWTDLIKKKYDI